MVRRHFGRGLPAACPKFSFASKGYFGVAERARNFACRPKRGLEANVERRFETLEDRTVPTTPEVLDLALLVDDGTSNNDGISTDPRLTGRVAADFAGGLPEVDFFVGAGSEQTQIGSVYVQADYTFVFRPDALSLGGHTIKAKARQWQPEARDEVVGSTATVSFTLVAGAGPTVTAEVGLYRDTGISTTDLETSDPRLVGHVTHNVDAFYLKVQFDYNADGTADASTHADLDNSFYFSPSGLTHGNKTIKVRGGYVDPATELEVYGAWTTFAFDYIANAAPTIEGLELVRDTGADDDDGVTYLAAFRGTLTDDEAIGVQVVELDWNGDDVVDATATVDVQGAFNFDPDVPFGEYDFRVRGRSYDDFLAADVVGNWATLEVDYAPPVARAVESFGLSNDNGASSTDNVTSDPTLHGSIDGAVEAAYLRLEVDRDGDSVVDDTLFADRFGNFDFVPHGLENDDHSIRVRTVEYFVDLGQSFPGPWSQKNFELVANAAPIVATLALVNDDGVSATDLATSDSRLRGTLGNADGSTAFLRVEYDKDSDGLVDGSTHSDTAGTFAFQPSGLEVGAAAVRVRAVEWDAFRAAEVVGAWEDIAFDYDPHPVPVVGDLANVADRLAVGAALDRFDSELGGSTTAGVLDRFAIGAFVPSRIVFDGRSFDPGIGYSPTLGLDAIYAEDELSISGSTDFGQFALTGDCTASSSVEFGYLGSAPYTTMQYDVSCDILFEYVYTETGAAPSEFDLVVTGTFHLIITASGTCSTNDLSILTGTYSIVEVDDSTFAYADGGSYSATMLAGAWTFEQSGTRNWEFSETGTLTTSGTSGGYAYLAAETSATAYVDEGTFEGIERLGGSSYSYGRRIPTVVTAGPNDGDFAIVIASTLDAERTGSGTFARAGSALTFDATETLELHSTWGISRDLNATYARAGGAGGAETGEWIATLEVVGAFDLIDERAFDETSTQGDFDYSLTETSVAAFDDQGTFVDGDNEGTYAYFLTSTTAYAHSEIGIYATAGEVATGSGSYEASFEQTVVASAELTGNTQEGSYPNHITYDWTLAVDSSSFYSVEQAGEYENLTGEAEDLEATVTVTTLAQVADGAEYTAAGTMESETVEFAVASSSTSSLEYFAAGTIVVAGATSTYTGGYTVEVDLVENFAYEAEGGFEADALIGDFTAEVERAVDYAFADQATFVIAADGDGEAEATLSNGETEVDYLATSTAAAKYVGTVVAEDDDFEVETTEATTLSIAADGTHASSGGTATGLTHVVTNLVATTSTRVELSGAFETATSTGEFAAIDTAMATWTLTDAADIDDNGEEVETVGDYELTIDVQTTSSYVEAAEFDVPAPNAATGDYTLTVVGETSLVVDESAGYAHDKHDYSAAGTTTVTYVAWLDSTYAESSTRNSAEATGEATLSLETQSQLESDVASTFAEEDGIRTESATTTSELLAVSEYEYSEIGTIETESTTASYTLTASAKSDLTYADASGYTRSPTGEFEQLPTSFSSELTEDSLTEQTSIGEFAFGDTVGNLTYESTSSSNVVLTDSGVIDEAGAASGNRTASLAQSDVIHYFESGEMSEEDANNTVVAWMNYERTIDSDRNLSFESQTTYDESEEAGNYDFASETHDETIYEGDGGFIQPNRPPYLYEFDEVDGYDFEYAVEADFENEQVDGSYLFVEVRTANKNSLGGWMQTESFGDEASLDPPPPENNVYVAVYGWGDRTIEESDRREFSSIASVAGMGALTELGPVDVLASSMEAEDRTTRTVTYEVNSTDGDLEWDGSSQAWIVTSELDYGSEYESVDEHVRTISTTATIAVVGGAATAQTTTVDKEEVSHEVTNSGHLNTTGVDPWPHEESWQHWRMETASVTLTDTATSAAEVEGAWTLSASAAFEFENTWTVDGVPTTDADGDTISESDGGTYSYATLPSPPTNDESAVFFVSATTSAVDYRVRWIRRAAEKAGISYEQMEKLLIDSDFQIHHLKRQSLRRLDPSLDIDAPELTRAIPKKIHVLITARQNFAIQSAKIATGFTEGTDEAFADFLNQADNAANRKVAKEILDSANDQIQLDFGKYVVDANADSVRTRLIEVGKLSSALPAKLRNVPLEGVSSRDEFRSKIAKLAGLASIFMAFDQLIAGKRAMADIANSSSNDNLRLLLIAYDRNAQRAKRGQRVGSDEWESVDKHLKAYLVDLGLDEQAIRAGMHVADALGRKQSRGAKALAIQRQILERTIDD